MSMKHLHIRLIPLQFLTSQEMLMYRQYNTCSWIVALIILQQLLMFLISLFGL